MSQIVKFSKFGCLTTDQIWWWMIKKKDLKQSWKSVKCMQPAKQQNIQNVFSR